MGKKKFTNEQEKQIAQDYIDGVPMAELLARTGYKTNKSICDKVKKYFPDYEIKRSTGRTKAYHLDFDKIDSRFKAYFIGLMQTDGYISSDIKFGIDLVDEDCIKYISEQTGQTYHKYGEDNTPGKILGKDVIRSARYRIVFSDRATVENLAKYGIVRRKTYTLKGFDLDLVPDELLPDLLRGIIDGDGCVYEHSDKQRMSFHVVSKSEDFIKWVAELCERVGMIEVKYHLTKDGMYKIDNSRAHNIEVLTNVVYAEPYGMTRKRNKLMETFRDYNRESQED